MAEAERNVVLTVFMEGTSNPMEHVTTQIALFSQLCGARELSCNGPGAGNVHDRPGHYKLCFAGCGVTHGIRGVIFAAGLRDQCLVVRAHLEAFLAAGLTVKLNFVGLSRGGIGGVYLAQELADTDPNKVTLHMLLFDPVPGNFINISRYVDWFGMSNANASMYVESCPALRRVLVLYPYQPLPWIAVHAPVLIRFPETASVEYDVILGCHQGALFLRPSTDTTLSFALIRDFLLELGTTLDLTQVARLNRSDEELLCLLEEELSRSEEMTRSTHCPDNGTLIVRYEKGLLLNRAHEKLLRKLGRVVPSAAASGRTPFYMLDIK